MPSSDSREDWDKDYRVPTETNKRKKISTKRNLKKLLFFAVGYGIIYVKVYYQGCIDSILKIIQRGLKSMKINPDNQLLLYLFLQLLYLYHYFYNL